MVVDPFSIAGAVGLAAGLTGFVASTIEKSVGQVKTATHAHQRLDGHQLALQTGQERLEAWARQWYENDGVLNELLSEKELRFLWGDDGYEKVESIKAAVLLEQEELCKLLYGKIWANNETSTDQRLWKNYMEGAKSCIVSRHDLPALPADFSRTFLIRVKTALWNENLLSASVTRLESRVDNLEKTSCILFHKAQQSRCSHYTQPSQEEIGAIIRQQRRMQHLLHDLLDAYDHLQNYRSHADLSFTPFDDAGICQLGTQHELTVTFLSVSGTTFHQVPLLTWSGYSVRAARSLQTLSLLSYHMSS